MKTYNFTINGNKYHVEIQKHEDKNITLEVNGTPYVVATERSAPVKVAQKSFVRKESGAAPSNAGSPSGTVQIIKAPLPGNIITIMVREGDTVTKGQKLLVYEAMKMENDVLAEGNGVVSKIHVHVGDTILQGADLMEIR
ncbi:biotin/lipoyl-binding protein [Bacteroidales bacterium OttesenSCG-928-K03]|nr:biotin/lipoyl-binding protein [Odoribacter sp. OttesenSCG-928-L07]MDL2239293.1 biotin/lipoyl-binding protein [Bacteroidales bacterium OttesenSCG-928-L14]MDL2243091.1 biotin/lipoyl-binding protein [Bacteroidales bacterium OttesenSCG-928-K03]